MQMWFLPLYNQASNLRECHVEQLGLNYLQEAHRTQTLKQKFSCIKKEPKIDFYVNELSLRSSDLCQHTLTTPTPYHDSCDTFTTERSISCSHIVFVLYSVTENTQPVSSSKGYRISDLVQMERVFCTVQDAFILGLLVFLTLLIAFIISSPLLEVSFTLKSWSKTWNTNFSQQMDRC